ncbi:MAG: TSUP family transporter, partial [Limnohabitans sp.]
MTFEPSLILELAVLGLCTGFLAGLLGIGGGMIMVPFLTWLLGQRGVSPDLAVKMALATSMATIIFTSVSSVRAHQARQQPDHPAGADLTGKAGHLACGCRLLVEDHLRRGKAHETA